MPADGEFLRGISRGIFGEMGRAEELQRTKDREKTLQTIDLLSNMASQLEPDSLPGLMDLLGKTIGVKGKTKNFWAAFSGTPDRSIEDQLGSIMNQATSSMVGPQEAKQARQTYKGELLEPFRASGTRPRSVEQLPYKTPPTLADRLILRDPRQEKLEEIETRYGAQLENQRVLAEQRYADALGKQKYQSDLRLQELNARNQAKSMEALNQLSTAYLAGGQASSIEEAVRMAGTNIGATADEQLNALRALAPLRAAQTTQAQTIAESMKTNQGLTPSQSFNVKKTADTIFGDFNKARGSIAESQKRMADISGAITSRLTKGKIRGRFDPNIGEIILDDPKDAIILSLDDELPKMLENYKKAAADIEGAKVTAEGKRKTLGTKQYSQYYKVGKTIDDPIEEVKEKKVTPPKTSGRTLRPGERVGMGTSRMGAFTLKEVPDPSKYPIGGTIRDPNTGKRFTIEKKVNNTLYLIPIQ